MLATLLNLFNLKPGKRSDRCQSPQALTSPPQVSQQPTTNQRFYPGGNNHAGRPIRVTRQVYSQLEDLSRLEKRGNYHAQTLLKEINRLRSGTLGNPNVYLSVTNHPYEREFSLILPGCKVIGYDRADGSYLLGMLAVDTDYFELQIAEKKPGLFFVHKLNGGRWDGDLIKTNTPTLTDSLSMIGISDRHKNINLAGKYTVSHLPKSTAGLKPSRIDEYNLFFTPGPQTVGGWRNYNQSIHCDSAQSLHEPAILLADAMTNAKTLKSNDTDGIITWVAARGGCGILLQAMEILKRRGEKLPNQTVFLSGPTVNISKIQSLIQALAMAKTGKSLFALKQGNLDELVFGGVSGASSIGQRLVQQGDDGYKATAGFRDGQTLVANAKSTVTTLGVISATIMTGASMLNGGSFASVALAIAGGTYGAAHLVGSNLPVLSHYGSLGSAIDDLRSR